MIAKYVNEVNGIVKKTVRKPTISFVKEGAKEVKRKPVLQAGLLDSSNDWVLLVDLQVQLSSLSILGCQAVVQIWFCFQIR